MFSRTTYGKSLLLIFVLNLGLLQCTDQLADEIKRDLPQIKERGKLVALTTFSPTSYFLYRGRTMGFEYELLELLAEKLDVELEIKVAEDLDELTNMLRRGEGDIIAHSLTITPNRMKQMAFTESLR
ncbi:MAG: transporter substrate-binding domain-containing protein, partial [Cyclobacteriaceae bacterium]